MRWFPALSAGIAFAIAALAIKGLALAGPEPIDDDAGFVGTLGERLEHEGFAIAPGPAGSLLARRGACRIKARDLPPMGTARLAFEKLGSAYGPTHYSWRGQWLADPPKYRPLLSFYLQRELARVGVAIERRSIGAIAISPDCPALSAATFDLPIYQR